MYRRIMVVTGDQSWSDVPIQYAIALAAETGAELSILMVLTPPLIAGMSDATACTLVVESIMAQSETILADIVATAEQAGIAYTTHVRWGNTADAGLRIAEEEDCDLIIVGSHACTWRGHRLLRHVIKKLTAFARQPLLVITEPLEETYRGTSWTRLLVVHDGSPQGEAVVRYARALAQEAALDICLLRTHSLRQSYGIDPFRGMPRVEDRLTATGVRTATARVNDDVVLAVGDTVTAIVETATDRACDVIILGAEPHRGWKRLLYAHTAEAVMADTTLPLLLVNRLATYCYSQPIGTTRRDGKAGSLMHQVRYAVYVVIVVAGLCLIAPATHWGGHVARATAKGTLRVAVVGFDRESTAPWEGSTPMLPYIGNFTTIHFFSTKW